jgi:hypothetical protein
VKGARYKGSNTGKRARRKNLRHPRERFYIPSDRYKDISYATIIINIPSDRNKDISYVTIIIKPVHKKKVLLLI